MACVGARAVPSLHSSAPFKTHLPRHRHRVVVVAARASCFYFSSSADSSNDSSNGSSNGSSEEVAWEESEEEEAPVHVYPEGDWRNQALRESLGDKERTRREALGRNFTYMLKIVYDGERYLGRLALPRGVSDWSYPL
jgi:hypothetical protein